MGVFHASLYEYTVEYSNGHNGHSDRGLQVAIIARSSSSCNYQSELGLTCPRSRAGHMCVCECVCVCV
ncbi:predicted protein [Plenodomus lingam JN3]|uniref:Predicted protein n=1 Tax=Leptosphaeria maculans (strain JN3 / isolate v23.1.3 / race Av1-4-5-6-7-8) TaxID=985895 RepID=E4ZZP1_LEPMJ|nr:predicted protein [Plenodomus lingam JN3]CBX97157.1 predicted protein [Plenodomus lingam JN3]